MGQRRPIISRGERPSFGGQSKVKLTAGLTAAQLSALNRVSEELAERGAREAREKEKAFFERCKARSFVSAESIVNTFTSNYGDRD